MQQGFRNLQNHKFANAGYKKTTRLFHLYNSMKQLRKKNIFQLTVILMVTYMGIGFISCGSDDDNNSGGNETYFDGETVNVDSNGKASDGHRFSKIDDTNFYIDDIKYSISEGNLTVSGYDKNSSFSSAKIISRLKYNGRTFNVTSIGMGAFARCQELTSITIPNSVTFIGYSAFAFCSGLTSVSIPNSVTGIGQAAFQECTGLTSITIPNSVTEIGPEVFYGCKGLTSITIPNSVTYIGDKLFSYCINLTSVTIPSNLTSIGDRTFEGCTSLSSFAIPADITYIGRYTFSGCSSLTSISIPEKVTTIGDSSFFNCI